MAGDGAPGLSAEQLELYSALFGAPATAAWAPTGDENTPVRAGGGCGTEEVPPDQAQQIERAVRKAMRGAAIERQQAVATAVEDAQKEAKSFVQDLTERLLVHKGRAVTAVNTDPAERVTDRRAHPSRNGGLFQPWLGSDGAGGDAAQTSDTL